MNRCSGRLLEEGNLEEAEEHKQRIEQMQRERRKILEESSVAHQPKFFRYEKDLCQCILNLNAS